MNLRVLSSRVLTIVVTAAWLVSGCSKSSVPVNIGDYELEASALSHEVILTWDEPDATNFNMYVSSDKNCDFADYSTCTDGSKTPNAISPYTAKGLQNDKAYYFKVEAVSADTRRDRPHHGRPDQLGP